MFDHVTRVDPLLVPICVVTKEIKVDAGRKYKHNANNNSVRKMSSEDAYEMSVADIQRRLMNDPHPAMLDHYELSHVEIQRRLMKRHIWY